MEYYAPQPDPEKKDRTLLRMVMAGCGCLVLIGILAAFFFGKFFSSMRGPTRTVRAHVTAINKGDYAIAYKLFAKQYREKNSMQQFRDDLEAFSSLLPFRESNLNRVNVENEKASVEGTLTARDGAIVAVSYELVLEKGQWRITSYQWASPGDRQSI